MYFISKIRKTMCRFQPLKNCLLVVRLEPGARSDGWRVKVNGLWLIDYRSSGRSLITLDGSKYVKWTVT